MKVKAGIAKRLIRTYFIIIAATVISGAFCLYVLGVNLRTNAEMRYVTLPSLEGLKAMKTLMLETEKLANRHVYIANNKDEERLSHMVYVEYPKLDSSLRANSSKWTDGEEQKLFNQVSTNNKQAIHLVERILGLLNKPESYTNDKIADFASDLMSQASRLITINNKLYTRLITTKEANLANQQTVINSLLDSLYVIVLFSVMLVMLVSYISARYSKRNVIDPLLKLNNSILDMATGNVAIITDGGRKDEIGQMHDAVNKMISGILQKIHFAEQIGKGNYNSEFKLLSDKDKLGIALLTMRNDLKSSNEALVEQDKRLIAAQKLARIGNFLYNMETGEFQSSPTLDDILGLDRNVMKGPMDWRMYILPEFHDRVAEKAVHAIKGHTKFIESYVVKRYNDGRECWVDAIGEYNYNEQGRAISMFGTMQDVTESKLLQMELNSSYQVAREQNNRLLNFSYIVSHNLRMHAVNIQSLLDLIGESETEEEKKELMDYLRTASDQLNETMHHLNDVVAMQSSLSVEVKPLSLKDYIDHTVDLLKTKLDDKGGTIINEVSDDVVVNYNPVYLDSILLNFLSNAIKYSHPDRKPLVTVTCHRAYTQKEHSRWVLEIKDNGLGIDLEHNKEKLFGIYKTFHGNEDAKGIGLFMTKYQIESMGGNVEVESKIGEGTTFRIFIK